MAHEELACRGFPFPGTEDTLPFLPCHHTIAGCYYTGTFLFLIEQDFQNLAKTDFIGYPQETLSTR
jgi:hypothetical protein